MLIKSILATVFLFAISSQVSGESINCYTCIQGNIPSSLKFRADIPSAPPACKDPIDDSLTQAIDTNGNVCIKINIKGSGTYQNTEVEVDGTLRYYFIEGKCGNLESIISNAADLGDLDLSADCYECSDDKCNSGTSIQISFLTFLALSASLYFTRS